VRHLSGLLETANVQLRDTAAGLRESEARRRSVESELAGGQSEAARLRDELERTALEVRNLQVEDKVGQEIGVIFSRISRLEWGGGARTLLHLNALVPESRSVTSWQY
jgi:hypothetical protein